MARTGGSRRGGARRTSSPGARPPVSRRTPRPAAAPSAPDAEPRVFRLGAVAGATPGKWIGIWRERMPDVELVLREVPASRQREALEGEVDAALVRLPLDDGELHVIPLYEETTVAVVPVESHLTAADELRLADLAGEIVIVPGDDVLGAVVPDAVAPAFAPPDDTRDAVATVAAGVGVVLVPMSLARLHARRDVAARAVVDAPTSRMGLAWRRDAQSPDVDTFIGIVRGRTANSSR